MILFVWPATTFADPAGVMQYLLFGVVVIWLLALAVNLLAGRRLVNGGLISAVILSALFGAAFLHHLASPAPWFGADGPEQEPTAHFLWRYGQEVGLPLLLSLVAWHWFRNESVSRFRRERSN